jgi:hypothetical protein
MSILTTTELSLNDSEIKESIATNNLIIQALSVAVDNAEHGSYERLQYYDDIGELLIANQQLRSVLDLRIARLN